jgi:hypothetical protein
VACTIATSGVRPPSLLRAPFGSAEDPSDGVLARHKRKGSLYALQWKHVDVKHGTLASFRTKTGRAQYFVGDPGLMTLLKAWRALRGSPGDDDPIVTDADVGYDR